MLNNTTLINKDLKIIFLYTQSLKRPHLFKINPNKAANILYEIYIINFPTLDLLDSFLITNSVKIVTIIAKTSAVKPGGTNSINLEVEAAVGACWVITVVFWTVWLTTDPAPIINFR